jgi:hypothetical protein
MLAAFPLAGWHLLRPLQRVEPVVKRV